MYRGGFNSVLNGKKLIALTLLISLLVLSPGALYARKKKKKSHKKHEETAALKLNFPDYSKIVWPNPPAVARIRMVAMYAAQRLEQVIHKKKTRKARWMDRLAGTIPKDEDINGALYQLAQPYGIAVDSQGLVYVADHRVGAIFVFNTETHEAHLIKNGVAAHFVRIIGLAIDDDGRLFVSDPGLDHILVFGPDHTKPTDVITEGLKDPGDMAIDTENRLLYVSDVDLDQVLVYDADTLKLVRKIGTTGHHHELTSPGNFSKPSGLAVDKDGNLYVCDTMNDRIEEFDAYGTFIRAWGKNGDGPGDFGRPKGIAIDSDGNIWVADGMQDRVKVFNQNLQLLIDFGGHGLMPGQHQGLVDIYIDKHDRVFTTEISPGRLQQMQYITNAQAKEERERRAKQRAQRAAAEGHKAGEVDSGNPAATAPSTGGAPGAK